MVGVNYDIENGGAHNLNKINILEHAPQDKEEE